MRFSLFQILKPKSSSRDLILQSAFALIEQLTDPQYYIAARLTREMEIEARRAKSKYSFPLFDFLLAKQIRSELRAVRIFLKNPERNRARANELFVAKELIRSREFFDTIESKPLTDEQRRAVVVDEDSNLLVAAAGSGKTSVIVAKAGWIIRRGYGRPSQLLLLAYSKDTQKEMQQRVNNLLDSGEGAEISIRTFHSLGMSIIGEVEGKKPALAKVAEDDRALSDLLKRIFGEMIQDRVFSTLLLSWFKSYFAPYRSITEFKNYGEYWNYICANEIRSLMGEKLKSFEECEIANYLYLNGVRYEYERPYEHETATSVVQLEGGVHIPPLPTFRPASPAPASPQSPSLAASSIPGP